MKPIKIALLLLLATFCASLWGQSDPAPPDDAGNNVDTTEESSADSTPPELSSWGLGFGLGVEQFRTPYIQDATVVGEDRVVATEKTYETKPSAWLTVNWNIWNLKLPGTRPIENQVTHAKWGFFAGIKVIGQDSETFNAFSLGPQASFVTEERVISVGLGWVTHPTRTYAKGITPGEPLPSRFDDILFEESTEDSYMLMMSISI